MPSGTRRRWYEGAAGVLIKVVDTMAKIDEPTLKMLVSLGPVIERVFTLSSKLDQVHEIALSLNSL